MYKSLLPQCCVNKIFLPPLYMYKSLLPQCCVNKVFYYPFTCTSPCCHSAVSILFLQLLYMYKSLLPQCCVIKGYYYPSTCTSRCCHSAVSIRVITTPLHVQVLTATLLCQKQLPTFHLVHILKRHLLNCVAP